MKQKKKWFSHGLKDGVPIGLGYFAVAFTLGIAAKNIGMTAAQATAMSLTNLTSAGEFAALGIISAGASYGEMALTQLIINLRYCLMSCSLSQKIDPAAGIGHRLLTAFGVTDEIFGVSMGTKGRLSPFYSYGIMTAAVPGWTLGTLVGVISGSVLPGRILSALSVALYAMFIAVIIPPAGKAGLSPASSVSPWEPAPCLPICRGKRNIFRHPDHSADPCHRRGRGPAVSRKEEPKEDDHGN